MDGDSWTNRCTMYQIFIEIFRKSAANPERQMSLPPPSPPASLTQLMLDEVYT